MLVEPSASEGIRQAAVSAVVFCAPDCSTFSRAREIPVPGIRCRQRRAEEFPLAFTTGLSEKECKRINDHNRIAEWTAVVCQMALEDGRSFMVENPLRSYLWCLPSFRALASDPSVSFVRCDSCMFGSSRCKPTGFLTNIPQAEHPLGRRCQGGDEKGVCDRTGLPHLSWDPIWDESVVQKNGKTGGSWFSPSNAEAGYTKQLAGQVAECIKAEHQTTYFGDCTWAFSEFFASHNATKTAAVEVALRQAPAAVLPEIQAPAAAVPEKSNSPSSSSRSEGNTDYKLRDHNRDKTLGEARGVQRSE